MRSSLKALFEKAYEIAFGSVRVAGLLRLIGAVFDEICFAERQKLVLLDSDSLEDVIAVQALMADLLEQQLVPISEEVLLREFKKTDFYRDHSENLADSFLAAGLHAHPRIEQVDGPSYGLKRSSWKRLAAIVMTLRKIGEPTHYTVITEQANRMLRLRRTMSTGYVQNILLSRSDVFAYVGIRGTYGLREWGLTPRRFS